MYIGQYYYNGTENDAGTINENLNDNLPYERKIKKIGIQAQPHSVFIINGVKIIIGDSGIFELDSDIEITSIQVPESFETYYPTDGETNSFDTMQEQLKELMETVLDVYSSIATAEEKNQNLANDAFNSIKEQYDSYRQEYIDYLKESITKSYTVKQVRYLPFVIDYMCVDAASAV